MSFDAAMETIVRGFEIAGVAVLAIGSLWALARGGRGVLRGERRGAYERARQDVGRSILLGLEILIIADIVQTITIDPTLESAATLGIIVLVRTFLSFSLEIELEGVVPWRRSRTRRGRLTGRPSAAARRGSTPAAWRGEVPSNGAPDGPRSARLDRERRPQRRDLGSEGGKLLDDRARRDESAPGSAAPGSTAATAARRGRPSHRGAHGPSGATAPGASSGAGSAGVDGRNQHAGEDAGQGADDPDAREHDEHAGEAPQQRHRVEVAVADRRDRHDAPPDARRRRS